MSNNIQFRRGSKQDYDAIKASGTDLHDIYLVGGSQHPNIITTTGEDGQTTSTEETKPLSMFVGDEQVQELIPNEITVTVGNAPGYAQGATIPAGTPISEIIFNLLSKEINPKTATKPGAALTLSGAPSGLKYVGDTVNIPKVTLSGTGGTFNSDWSGTPTQPTPSFDRSNYKITITNEAGFDGYPTEDQNGTQILQTAATVVAGSNKRTFGGSYSYTAPSNSPITNLNNIYTGSDATWVAGTTSVPSNGLKTVSVTGVYRIYTNGKYVTGNGPGNAGSITGYEVKQYEPTTLLDTYNVSGRNIEFKASYKQLHSDDETRILHLPINMELVSQNTWGVSAHDSDAYFEFDSETTEHENTDGIKYNVFKWTSNNGTNKFGDNTVLFKVKVTSSDPYASEKTNN